MGSVFRGQDTLEFLYGITIWIEVVMVRGVHTECSSVFLVSNFVAWLGLTLTILRNFSLIPLFLCHMAAYGRVWIIGKSM